MPKPTATIIGGGIGGLAAALTLKRAGLEVRVYERAELSSEAGAGFTLWSVALGILDDLGLTDAMSEHAVTIHESEICGADGVAYPGLWLGSFVDDSEDVLPICIHRSIFQRILIDALGEDSIENGRVVVGVEPGSIESRATVTFSDGQTISADVVVGADGIHSVVRTRLFPDVEPAYNEQTIYRGITGVPASTGTRPPFVAIDQGTRFGWAPLPGDRAYWFAGCYQAEHEPDPAQGRKAFLLETFGSWAPPVADLINSTPEHRILRNDVYTVGPMEEWSVGRATLLGDAAHAIPPHVGHGACLAIEDAAALADALGGVDQSGVPEALRVYAERRAGRTGAIFTKGSELGSGLQAGNLQDARYRARSKEAMNPL